MIEQINILRNKLLDSLLSELKKEKPGFVEKLEQGTPENFYNYHEAEKELDKPIEPWTELLSSLLDFELGFDFLKLSVEQMPKAVNGRELHLNFGMFAIYMRASLERLEHFLKN